VQRDWLVNRRGHLTQEDVARLAGIARSTYALIETGKRDPSVRLAKKIAKALKFEWAVFFGDKIPILNQRR
jgi:putative transcriptional regulator